MTNILLIFIIIFFIINEFKKKEKKELIKILIKEVIKIEEYTIKYNKFLQEKENNKIENIEEFNKEIEIFNKEINLLKSTLKTSQKIFLEMFPQDLYKESLKVNNISEIDFIIENL